MDKNPSEKLVRNIKRHTRKKFSAEEKINIILEGLRGEDSVQEICRRVGINPNTYYNWSKAFMEAGKRRLNGDTMREANTDEVTELRKNNNELKELTAELALENRWLKKTVNGVI